MNRYTRMITYVKKKQWFNILSAIAKHVPDALLVAGKDYVIKFNREKEISYRKLRTYSIRHEGRQGISKILDCEKMFFKRGLYEKFFLEGNECYLVETNKNKAVAFCWVHQKKYDLTYDGYRKTKISFSLPDNIRVLGNGFIEYNHRLVGIFPYMLLCAIENCLKEDCYIFGFVNFNNEHSLKSHLRLGFIVHSVVTLIKVGPFSLFRIEKKNGEKYHKCFTGNELKLNFNNL